MSALKPYIEVTNTRLIEGIVEEGFEDHGSSQHVVRITLKKEKREEDYVTELTNVTDYYIVYYYGYYYIVIMNEDIITKWKDNTPVDMDSSGIRDPRVYKPLSNHQEIIKKALKEIAIKDWNILNYEVKTGNYTTIIPPNTEELEKEIEKRFKLPI